MNEWHPSDRQLQDFLDGILSQEEDTRINVHLAAKQDNCPLCRPRFDALVPEPRGQAVPERWVPGMLIGGKYRIEDNGSEGGQGVVYRARWEDLDRLMALKTISPERLRYFRTEAKSLASLTHQYIVPIYDWGEHEGKPYFVMEYLPGGSLSGHRPAPHQAAEIVEKLARAVHFAHSQAGKKIIHRDLKPGNILKAVNGDWKITDYGMALVLSESAGPRHEYGPTSGTPVYLAPEQASGQQDRIGSRTDVYGLSAILYELLAAHPPFDDSEVRQNLRLIQTLPPRPLPRTGPGAVPPDLAAICFKGLSKEPEQRYESAEELADDLRRFLENRPTVARRPWWPRRLTMWAGRDKAAAAALGLLLLLTGVLTQASLWINQSRHEVESQNIEIMHEKDLKEEALTRADVNLTKAKTALENETAARQLAQESAKRANRQSRLALDAMIFAVEQGGAAPHSETEKARLLKGAADVLKKLQVVRLDEGPTYKQLIEEYQSHLLMCMACLLRSDLRTLTKWSAEIEKSGDELLRAMPRDREWATTRIAIAVTMESFPLLACTEVLLEKSQTADRAAAQQRYARLVGMGQLIDRVITARDRRARDEGAIDTRSSNDINFGRLYGWLAERIMRLEDRFSGVIDMSLTQRYAEKSLQFLDALPANTLTPLTVNLKSSSHKVLGQIAFYRNQMTAARHHLQESLRLALDQLKKEKESEEALRTSLMVYAWLAQIELGNDCLAYKDWMKGMVELLEQAPAAFRAQPKYQADLKYFQDSLTYFEKLLQEVQREVDTARAHCRNNRPAEVAAVAQKLKTLYPKHAWALLQAARCYALNVAAAAQDPVAQKTYTVAAAGALESAVKCGYRDWERLENDPDFAPLKAEAAFHKLIDTLKNPDHK